MPFPYRRISKVTIITNNASPQLERLPKPVLHHEAALGYAPHPAEYFIPTGNKVNPIVITTTPETIGGIYLRS